MLLISFLTIFLLFSSRTPLACILGHLKLSYRLLILYLSFLSLFSFCLILESSYYYITLHSHYFFSSAIYNLLLISCNILFILGIIVFISRSFVLVIFFLIWPISQHAHLLLWIIKHMKSVKNNYNNCFNILSTNSIGYVISKSVSIN